MRMLHKLGIICCSVVEVYYNLHYRNRSKSELHVNGSRPRRYPLVSGPPVIFCAEDVPVIITRIKSRSGR